MKASNIVLARINATYIPIQTCDFNESISLVQEGNSFSIMPTVQYVANKQPIANLTTNAVDIALNTVGIGNLTLDSTSTFDMWIATMSNEATDAYGRKYYDTTGAVKISFTSGVCIFESLSVSENNAATVSYRVLGSEDSGSVGVTITPNQTIPDATSICQDHVFVCGPMVSGDSSSVFNLTGWDFNQNYSERYIYTAGKPVPSQIVPESITPVFNVNSNDIESFKSLIADNEILGCIDGYKLYLRKTDPCASRIANNVSEHIEFTINKGTLTSGGVTGGYRQIGDYPYTINVTDDCSNVAPISIDTAATIPSNY